MTKLRVHITAKEILHFLLFSNWWVSFSLSGLALGYTRYYGIKHAWTFAVFALAGTYFTYNFHRMVRIGQFPETGMPPRVYWQKHHQRGLIVTTVIAGVIAGITFFMLPIDIKGLISLACAGFIVFFYVLPIPLIKIRFRNVPFAKDIMISLVWVLLLIAPELNRNISIDIPLTTMIGFWVYVQIIPFDIRDLSYDPKHLKTLPQVAGALGARIICTGFTIAFTWFLLDTMGFHWMLVPAIVTSQLGMWWKQTANNKEWLELLWDGNLLLTGLYLFLVNNA